MTGNSTSDDNSAAVEQLIGRRRGVGRPLAAAAVVTVVVDGLPGPQRAWSWLMTLRCL